MKPLTNTSRRTGKALFRMVDCSLVCMYSIDISGPCQQLESLQSCKVCFSPLGGVSVPLRIPVRPVDDHEAIHIEREADILSDRAESDSVAIGVDEIERSPHRHGTARDIHHNVIQHTLFHVGKHFGEHDSIPWG